MSGFLESEAKLAHMNSTPFSVQTPEDLSATEAAGLFVETPESKTLSDAKHTFVHGPRGSGKSMNFRWLMPDVQMLHKGAGAQLIDLPFFAAHFGVKVTGLGQLEMGKLRDDARLTILGEHQLVLHMLAALFKSLSSSISAITLDATQQQEGLTAFRVGLVKILDQGDAGFSKGRFASVTNVSEAVQEAVDWIDYLATQVQRYFARQVIQLHTYLPWSAPIYDYSTTLEPIVRLLRQLSFMC